MELLCFSCSSEEPSLFLTPAALGGAWSKSQVQSQQTASVLKMKDPLSTCCVSIIQGKTNQNLFFLAPVGTLKKHPSVFQYNKLYQDVKQLSKAGECFCKDLMTVFQQR